jgi:cytochrome c oxidase subunit II
MFSPLAAVVPPTVAIWTHLADYYIFFGTAAGVVVTCYMVYNIVKNRAREGRQAPKFHEEKGEWGNWKGAILTLLVTGSVLGFVEYQTFASVNLIVPPDPPAAVHIGVIAQQWSWTFVYPNGLKLVGNLTVPADTEVILNITSIDVTHSFSLAMLNVAKDATPGHFNTLWFNATSPGVYADAIRCKELCGVGHALMTASLTVVPPAAYQTWYAKTGGT